MKQLHAIEPPMSQRQRQAIEGFLMSYPDATLRPSADETIEYRMNDRDVRWHRETHGDTQYWARQFRRVNP